VSDNNIHDNASMGIELEAVFHGTVARNRIACNARTNRHSHDRSWFWGAAIMAKNVTGYTLRDNDIIVHHGQGIALVDNGDRGSGPYGIRRSANAQIFENTITFTSRSRSGFFDGRTGVESDREALDAGLDATDPAANNQLYANRFVFSDADYAHWRYAGESYPYTDIPSQWENASTFDVVAADSVRDLCR
jgi:hypothetical protein